MSAKIGACAQVTRVLLIILNILFLLLGIGLIAGGSVLVATGRTFQIFNGAFSAVGISALIIVAGIFTFLISAIAILGAIFKSRILLGIYLVVVVLIILLEVVAAIVGGVYHGKLDVTLDSFVNDLIQKYGQNDTASTGLINAIQTSFQCCGWSSYQDYTNKSLSFPVSCDCPVIPPPNKCTTVDNVPIWSTPCKSVVTSAFSTYLAVIIAVAVLFALTEVIAVLCALGLCCCIHRAVDENNYTKV